MLIGLDFDNTIANYDSVFKEICAHFNLLEDEWSGTKKELKETIFSFPDGEETWMKIQGKAYGEFMNKAELMPGVANFLFNCMIKKIPVCVISHKTEYGHFDEKKVALRTEAMKWMEEKSLFDESISPLNKNNVFFYNTRKEKVKKISALECTHFVDDLVEVFKEPHFPKNTKKILLDTSEKEKISKFRVFNNWMDISNVLLGKQNLSQVKKLIASITNSKPQKIKLIKRGGNSQVYEINLKSKNYVLKIYPDLILDPRPRLETEFKALKFLHDQNIRNVPKPKIKNKKFNIGIYSLIEGKQVSNISIEKIEQCVGFVNKLKEIKNTRYKNFDHASEACLSGKSLKDQIRTRLNNLSKVSNSNQNLKTFITKTFLPLSKEIESNYYSRWPVNSLNNNLDKKHLILSPSDFGLHNSLINSDNEISFLDFEYFGWDDPVKLTSDFYWHPAMKLKENQKLFWLESMRNVFNDTDDYFEQRLESALPFYALRWILILLNEFLVKEQKRRNHAKSTEEYNWDEVKKSQLSKALDLSNSLRKYIEK